LKPVLHILLFISLSLQAQNVLQIRKVRFNRVKKTEIQVGEWLEYKLKGEHHYTKDLITDMHDSTLVFGNGFQVNIRRIKAIKTRNMPRLLATTRKLAFEGGVLLLAVDVINNTLVFKRDEVVNPKVGVVALCFLATALLIEELSVKRLHMNGRNSIRIIDENYSATGR
jgi:hypothetical protein